MICSSFLAHQNASQGTTSAWLEGRSMLFRLELPILRVVSAKGIARSPGGHRRARHA